MPIDIVKPFFDLYEKFGRTIGGNGDRPCPNHEGRFVDCVRKPPNAQKQSATSARVLHSSHLAGSLAAR
jgi:hypothetical protein